MLAGISKDATDSATITTRVRRRRTATISKTTTTQCCICPNSSRFTFRLNAYYLLIAAAIWSFLYLLPIPVLGFNLEQRQPLIKYGHPNSYFGYSLATHTIGEYNWPNNTKCLLVGAPLDRNRQPNTNESGALYMCPISTDFNDCEQVITDGRRSYDVDELIPPSSDEIKEGQWMGVTVRSQGLGGKVLICAHRYVTIVRENRYGQGLCYVLTNDLQFDEVYEPCKGRSVQRQHEDYGFCQVGTSGALLDDNTMVLGTPGPFTWRGAIFVTEIGGEYLERDKNMYYSDHSDASSPVDKYSYLGMAVTGGRYFGERMSYAAGAPRSNGHGQVVIFDKANTSPIPVRIIIDGEQFASSFGYELTTADINGDQKPDLIVAAPFYFTKSDGGAVYIYQNDKDMLPKRPSLRLTGALESRFGLALANIGDLNKDSCEDLAVGAPYEGDGVVYIYLGSRQGLNEKPSQRIQASELGRNLPQPIRTFGISIAGNTDLDGNSYMDMVVGAPPAAVVLLARPIINIQTTYRSNETRNIDPNRPGCRMDVFTNLTCFTFEACCSIDPHEQLSKVLNLLYTVEAETFEHHKKFSRVFFDRDNKRSNVISRLVKVRTDGRVECQLVTGYIKANTRDIQTPIRFRLDYKLEEPELAESPLIRLNPILDQTQANIEFEGTFQKDCGDDDLCESDLLLNAEPNLDEEAGEYALILGNKTELEVMINVANLADSAYEAQLFISHQKSVSYIATKKPTNATCNSFNTTLVACSLGNPMLRGTTTFVTIRFDPNSLEPEETQMVFQIFANTTSKLIGKQLPEKKLTVRVVRRAELTLRGWVNPEQSFYSGASKLLDVPMELDDVGSPLVHTYSIFNEGPSAAPKVLLVIYLPLKLEGSSGTVELDHGAKEQYLQYLEDKPSIETGQGECTVAPEHVNPLKLTSKLAANLQSGSYLNAPAAMMKWPTLRQQQQLNKSQTQHWSHSQSLSPSQSKSESLQKSSQDKEDNGRANRLPRNTLERILRPERFMDERESGVKGKKQQVVELNCDKMTAHCIKIQCEFYAMPAKTEAQVILKARLWNSTLVAVYPRVDLVRIVSTARVKIPADFGVEQMENNDQILVETRAYPELLDQQRETYTPMWIIILAVIVGILVLAFFTYAMWKCGFFKRYRPTDPTLSGNLEKINEEKPFLGAKSSHNVF